ncbi:MBL fold metallo-hydrolase RNA specificity domain-containing protein [Ideonella alba]|uniref:MBL fold metallo-hydrolase n=1 Tax=Ideonella alba TaxID=2824118 RepID=A0A940Y842_9BURK|nr:MBL fold metallo-hydrolase [Ideonella alba]MBQ0931627.1 MBL fold metallo-hydrolase [Ideonella alba]
MQIDFLGAADCVTGSRHLIDWNGRCVLLDAGLFQGFKVLRERNWAPPGFDVRSLDAVVLSHAHLDHSGWLPALVRHGYRGPIYSSPATRDLAEVLLLDAAHLQEEDARRANRHGFSRHAKALPLFTQADARSAMKQFVSVTPGRAKSLGGGLALQLVPAGHLLGACSVLLSQSGERLLFSGDLGRQADLLMPPPANPPEADVLLIESTYGNRLHPQEDDVARLGAIVRDTIGRGGSVLLPAFAVGRAQALLLALQRLKSHGEIPARLPVFLDSPMAIEATELYRRHRQLLRVPQGEMARLVEHVTLVTTGAQSQRLARSQQAGRLPAVIISASGMATGGRVLNHLKAMAPDPRHAIVFAGFQVGGSRGALMVGGAADVKIHGEFIPIRARVEHLSGLSGHADADELMAWLRHLPRPPRQTYVVHGEPEAADALRQRIARELGWAVRVPPQGGRFLP